MHSTEYVPTKEFHSLSFTLYLGENEGDILADFCLFNPKPGGGEVLCAHGSGDRLPFLVGSCKSSDTV